MEFAGNWFYGLVAWMEPFLSEKDTEWCKKKSDEIYGKIELVTGINFSIGIVFKMFFIQDIISEINFMSIIV